jgi:hypothetical protein
MATKTASRKTETVVETVEETPVTPTPQDLDVMLAQKRALDEQIKAAKAAMPQLSKLERVIERQTANPDLWLRRKLWLRAVERAKAGQPPTEAVDAVLALYRSGMLAALIPATDDATN